MTAGRVLYAGLRLLDRQMLDRDGVPCGNVDDLELTPGADGDALYVTAIHAGPGALLYRMGRRRLGAWLQWAHDRLAPEGEEISTIPFQHVRDLGGSHVTLGLGRKDLATFSQERWVRDHIIGPIPGSQHEAE
ncbi:MAG: hypothetical protein JO087_11870 [Actinobacteria bacterium]|nr:hypothetical protein [Actinomycetota bacterium]